MPGQLKSDAQCPQCSKPIIAVFCSYNAVEDIANLEFQHSEANIAPCVRSSNSLELAEMSPPLDIWEE